MDKETCLRDFAWALEREWEKAMAVVETEFENPYEKVTSEDLEEMFWYAIEWYKEGEEKDVDVEELASDFNDEELLVFPVSVEYDKRIVEVKRVCERQRVLLETTHSALLQKILHPKDHYVDWLVWQHLVEKRW